MSIRISVFSYIRAATPVFLIKKLKDISSCQLSKPIKGGEAYELGLVDALASPNDLVNTARQWALDIYELRRPWIKSLYKTDKLEPLGEAREILKFARAQAQKQAANLHHPLVCIDVVEEGILGGGLMGSGIATAMILSNYPVVLKEVNEKFLNAGIDRIKGRII